MRNFFISLLGSLAALVIFCTCACFFGLVLIFAIVASSKKDQQGGSFEEGSYLVFKMDANLQDAPPSADFQSLLQDDSESLQLRSVVRAIRSSAKDPKIAGIFLTGSFTPSGYGSSFAALKELRAALQEVRAAGKPIKAYLTDADTRDFYIASVASEIDIDPFGMVLLPGLASRPMFYAGAFDKFGIGVQVTRVGKYKSAVEPFIRKDLSPENREQLGSLLGDLWHVIVEDISASRSLKAGELQRLVDSEGIIRADTALQAKLVDRIQYRDQVIDELKAKTGRIGSKESFKQVSLDEYMKVARDPAPEIPAKEKRVRGRVAIVYAEGEIVDGEGDTGQIGGASFARELRKLRQDDDVKAVVLRVNSPGGSASASETILREVRLTAKKMPVIVSMGGYAASGGYWISSYGTRIYAEPSTITGSIGVYGLFLDFEKLSQSVGLSYDTVKTGKYADMFSVTRPKTEAEMAIMQRMVDWVYEEFVNRVTEARKLKREKVEEIAQGRVWSGITAQKLGLVDEIGGLDAALRDAGVRAGLGEHPRVSEYPRKKELSEVIADLIQKVHPGAHAKAPLGHNSAISQVTARVEAELSSLRAYNDPQGIYARLPLNITVD